jgi:uncharacterized protein YegP (UPF0339 family)
MTQLFIQLAQTVTGAVFTIVLLLLVAALIGYLTAWFYAKSVYKPIIKDLEDEKAGLIADKAALNKQVEGLKDENNKLNSKLGELNTEIKKLNAEIAKLKATPSEMDDGKFVVAKAKNGETFFNLKSVEGHTILRSEMYTTRAACNNGIDSVRKNCQSDQRYERMLSSNDKHYFNLKASNGQIIGTSEMFESADGMENGINSVKLLGKTSIIEDDLA